MDYNTVVIGAGPAGMAACLYLKRAGLDVLLIDKDAPGGQMLKTSNIENYLGFDLIDGASLSLNMFNQVKKASVDFVFDEVVSVVSNGYYVVKTLKSEFKCKNVVVATGRTCKKLDLPGVNSINGISYCAVCDGMLYKDKKVGVVGGGDAAFTNALFLSNLCEHIYIFVRKDVSASSSLVSLVSSYDNITVLCNTEIGELVSHDNNLTGILSNDGRFIDLEGLFVSIGGIPQTDFIDFVDKDNGYIKVDDHMRTSSRNVYACGDVILKDYYQIVTAVSDGAIAALSIKECE